MEHKPALRQVGQGGFTHESRFYCFGVVADVMAVATPWRSWLAVLAALLTMVAQRFVQDWTIEPAEVTPLASVSATFCNRLPTAMKRSKKTPPLFSSFAIAEYLFK